MGIAFWKGKIELMLQKHSYSPGETINGEIHLKLKKPIKARKIEIRLLGQEKITSRHVSSRGGYHTRTNTYTICDVRIPLDGEKDYLNGCSQDHNEFLRNWRSVAFNAASYGFCEVSQRSLSG